MLNKLATSSERVKSIIRIYDTLVNSLGITLGLGDGDTQFKSQRYMKGIPRVP